MGCSRDLYEVEFVEVRSKDYLLNVLEDTRDVVRVGSTREVGVHVALVHRVLVRGRRCLFSFK